MIANPKLTVDRRSNNRRKIDNSVEESNELEQFEGEERREKKERRRQIDPTTCERDYSNDEVDFMRAMDDYKRKSGRQFPTWSEVLEVLHSMGYRRVAEESEIEIKSR